MLFGQYCDRQKLSKPSAARSSRGRLVLANSDSRARACRAAREILFDIVSVEERSDRPMADKLSQLLKRLAISS